MFKRFYGHRAHLQRIWGSALAFKPARWRRHAQFDRLEPRGRARATTSRASEAALGRLHLKRLESLSERATRARARACGRNEARDQHGRSGHAGHVAIDGSDTASLLWRRCGRIVLRRLASRARSTSQPRGAWTRTRPLRSLVHDPAARHVSRRRAACGPCCRGGVSSAARAADLATLSDGAARVCAHLHAGPVAHAVVRALAHLTAVMHVLAVLKVPAVGRPPAAVWTPRVRVS